MSGHGSGLPLSDVRVLDLSRLLPGGFCSLMLADFGADVVKVEDTGAGDYVRWMEPCYDAEDRSVAGAMYLSWNRNKRSVQLDLKSEEGREAFLRLADEADVVLESFRPGVMDRLGIGYDVLKERNPRIVLCSISGYGQDGPYRLRSGHDLNYLAMTGLLDLSAELDGPPIQPAAQIADVGGGALMATIGILVALQERERSGLGQFVDISMVDGTMAWAGALASRYFCDGRRPEPGTLALRGGMVSYMAYPCKDGWVTLGAVEPKFWEEFCRGIGREDLVPHREDPSDGWAQGQLEMEFRRRTRAEWEAFAEEHDCCLQVVLPVHEAVEHEHVRARELVVELEQPGIGPVKAIAPPIKLSRTPADPHRLPAPGLGEHTEQVLAEAWTSSVDGAAPLIS